MFFIAVAVLMLMVIIVNIDCYLYIYFRLLIFLLNRLCLWSLGSSIKLSFIDRWRHRSSVMEFDVFLQGLTVITRMNAKPRRYHVFDMLFFTCLWYSLGLAMRFCLY